MDSILEMAKELGYAIQRDDRFVRTQMAQAGADEDKQLQDLIGQFNLKRMAVSGEAEKEKRDEKKIEALNRELRELYDKIMENEHMVAYNEARTELDKLVNQVAELIAMSAHGQDPADYQEHSCSGDCGCCSGCH
ncbi:MAG: YlbF family regulator [Clostridia bacterium]|nr:YlbF family regulator [Clostridia bacterium]